MPLELLQEGVEAREVRPILDNLTRFLAERTFLTVANVPWKG